MKQIEAEGGEILLKNKAGDYVIIPKKYRLEVQDMIKENCHSCIDKLVETLPVMEDYALDGSIIPSWDKVKSVRNEQRGYGEPFMQKDYNTAPFNTGYKKGGSVMAYYSK